MITNTQQFYSIKLVPNIKISIFLRLILEIEKIEKSEKILSNNKFIDLSF